MKPPSNHRTCSICGVTKTLAHYFYVETKKGRFFGRVCDECLGIGDHFSFNILKRREQKQLHTDSNDPDALLSEIDDLFRKEDEDEGESGWDPEDRAKTKALLLGIDAEHLEKLFKQQLDDELTLEDLAHREEYHDALEEKALGEKEALDAAGRAAQEKEILKHRKQSSQNKIFTKKKVQHATATTKPADTKRSLGSLFKAAKLKQAAPTTKAESKQEAKRAPLEKEAPSKKATQDKTPELKSDPDANITSQLTHSLIGTSAIAARNKLHTGMIKSVVSQMFQKNAPADSQASKEARAEVASEEAQQEIEQTLRNIKNTWRK